MSSISLHVLDTTEGAPASGLLVTLKLLTEPSRGGVLICQEITDADGRIRELLPQGGQGGLYHISIAPRDHSWPFYPNIEFEIMVDEDRHHHIPLVLSRYGFFSACMPS
uniref:5-hydroxyisourate hydrolase n=1 Tax=Candidatus Kentrum sp. LFY TaxID=2126342 RepID=A0A450UME8_9GAMM|nr:MAG: 5-hydroxyisourate hydrolase [Candidatus Kentron sp. LFY]